MIDTHIMKIYESKKGPGKMRGRKGRVNKEARVMRGEYGQICTTLLGLFTWSWDPNSDPHAQPLVRKLKRNARSLGIVWDVCPHLSAITISHGCPSLACSLDGQDISPSSHV